MNDFAPAVWPECSECHRSYVLRRALRVAFGDWVWLWQRDCKHKNAEPVVVEAV